MNANRIEHFYLCFADYHHREIIVHEKSRFFITNDSDIAIPYNTFIAYEGDVLREGHFYYSIWMKNSNKASLQPRKGTVVNFCLLVNKVS